MKKENDNKIRKGVFGRHRVLGYGMLTLAVLMVAVIAVQMAPGGTEDTSAADITINLDNKTGGAGLWSGDTLTINNYSNKYSITQNTTDVLDRNIIVADSSTNSTVTITIKDINIKGNITLEGNASVILLLDNTNNIAGRIIMSANASITIDSLTGGSLDVTSAGNFIAIGAPNNSSASNTITIAGGTVTATGGSNGRGIEGKTIIINDGTVTATGGSYSIVGTTITINDGTVTATGGSYGIVGTTITINDGTVTATGGGNGAGIISATITINDGTVTATGGGNGAGIGGATITINDGTVTATGGSTGGAGIGGGNGSSSSSTITISGGTVTATGGSNGAGIGGGNGGNGGTITISGGTVTATGGSTGGAGIGGGNGASSGAALTIKKDASVIALARGDLPAVHASSINDTSTGYFVNGVLNSNLPLASTLVVYANGNTSTPLATLTPPAAAYKNFAFMLPGSSSPKNYNIYAKYSEGSQPVLYASSDSPVIVSKQSTGYDEMRLGAVITVAVTGISDLPNEAVAGTPLTLSGTVSPSDATYQTITWSVKDIGDTGATISGDVLSTTGKGSVTVTATIANGTADGTDYKKDFTITVSAEGEEGSGGGSNTLLWVGIAAVIIVLLIVTVFLLQKKGIIKGI